MKFFGCTGAWQPQVRGVIFDVDETLYERTDDYVADQRAGELRAIAADMSISLSEADALMQRWYDEHGTELGRKVSAAEAMRFGGYSQEWIVAARVRCWRPADFLQPFLGLPEAVLELIQSGRKVALASTSPREILMSLLPAIGLSELVDMGIPILGGGCAPAAKPDPAIYRLAAERLGLDPSLCLSVGDREAMDCVPAVRIGMRAVHIQGPGETLAVIRGLL